MSCAAIAADRLVKDAQAIGDGRMPWSYQRMSLVSGDQGPVKRLP